MTSAKLQHELTARNLNPSEAARVLRIARSTLYRYFTGETTITPDRAELIRLRLADYDAGRT